MPNVFPALTPNLRRSRRPALLDEGTGSKIYDLLHSQTDISMHPCFSRSSSIKWQKDNLNPRYCLQQQYRPGRAPTEESWTRLLVEQGTSDPTIDEISRKQKVQDPGGGWLKLQYVSRSRLKLKVYWST